MVDESRKKKFQDDIHKMKSTLPHSNAGGDIDMIPYLKKYPEATARFLKDTAMKEHEHPYWNGEKK